MTSPTTDMGGAARLLTAAAVREGGQRMLALALDDRLDDWTVRMERLPAAADLVADVTRAAYPRLDPPFHARWRHLVFDGRDLWGDAAAAADWASPAAKGRAAFDLAITSVLLDAGAGPDWRFRDPASGRVAQRSEGLAVASFRWFAAGGFSRSPSDPLRADAAALSAVDAAQTLAAFQASADNPLVGAEGRAALLNRLGEAVAARPDLFAREDEPRPGGLFDALAARAEGGRLPAAALLETLLDGLGGIWPERPTLEGVSLGDCWPHPALTGPAPADGYVPFHKLSQWLAYSLVEPLEEAGFVVEDVDALTGLAEYRNGGLFVDVGVLAPRDRAGLARAHGVDSAFVVGWRALTVALLDAVAAPVRERLGVSAADFPLACVLEGGTWAAGRAIARERRADGGPPFAILSDGTVF
ncbi:MAG: URC4/urg3 family protein [Caulobacterales bacterium]|nr:URC4/urg3 family protein [Caulobacterales bacterium]